jgi:hypothetical protein
MPGYGIWGVLWITWSSPKISRWPMPMNCAPTSRWRPTHSSMRPESVVKERPCRGWEASRGGGERPHRVPSAKGDVTGDCLMRVH